MFYIYMHVRSINYLVNMLALLKLHFHILNLTFWKVLPLISPAVYRNT